MRRAIVKFSHNTRTNPIAPLNIMTAAIYMDSSESLRDRQAKALIDIRIRRLSMGNPGDAKPVGQGVSELRIDYGPERSLRQSSKAEGVVSRSPRGN